MVAGTLELARDETKLNKALRDIDKWQSMDAAERAQLLHRTHWAEFNAMANAWTDAQVFELRTSDEPQIKKLRELFNKREICGDTIELAREITDLTREINRRL